MYSDVESFSSDERGAHVKKTNKPMMEKKRRARINQCLSELKEILICDKHASSGHAKWEKADILEMTVDYLKKLRAHRDPASQFCVAGPVEGLTQPTKACDSNSTSAAPSPSSAESTSDGPTIAKRRRNKSPSPSTTHEVGTNQAPSSASHALQIFPPTRMPALAPQLRPANTFSFMSQHLLALQYQQNLKMAAMQPGILSAITPMYPFAAVSTIPWRGM
ncbi:hypothetical protein KIN20_002492 [Parelaphostrongylus tenuis]|uniref:BHLH domain-containing protein n=1 Tax=Parelaphostrongylus tenuis TaxID=148309 RepID=A0AAD5QGS9_PARTN|nr:hypothetical protein KIN20_002492 [Parelaphostrongylus tenuis]